MYQLFNPEGKPVAGTRANLPGECFDLFLEHAKAWGLCLNQEQYDLVEAGYTTAEVPEPVTVGD